MTLSLIVAMDRNRLIGCNNQLPWHLPADLAHFKKTTMGKPILMGRKTYDSIGRPLPGRLNIVLSRSKERKIEGVEVVTGIEEAKALLDDSQELMVIGGSTVYAMLLDEADRIYLTEVDGEFEGDAWFPALDLSQWREVAVEARGADEKNPYACRFITLQRKA
ncbi:MAG TPA: type 3 dihydrofolate reductase [Thiotrichales bacterium]|nr:type 3 dihydrofolate reductase [Thiotrichales bacterium]